VSVCPQVSHELSVKSRQFNLPHLYLAPALGVTPFEFCQDLRHQKTRVPGLSCGIVCVIPSCFSKTLTCYRQTDRHTTTAYAVLAWRGHAVIKRRSFLSPQNVLQTLFSIHQLYTFKHHLKPTSFYPLSKSSRPTTAPQTRFTEQNRNSYSVHRTKRDVSPLPIKEQCTNHCRATQFPSKIEYADTLFDDARMDLDHIVCSSGYYYCDYYIRSTAFFPGQPG